MVKKVINEKQRINLTYQTLIQCFLHLKLEVSVSLAELRILRL